MTKSVGAYFCLCLLLGTSRALAQEAPSFFPLDYEVSADTAPAAEAPENAPVVVPEIAPAVSSELASPPAFEPFTPEANAVTPEVRPERNVEVLASSLNVRTSNRAILCTVPRGTPLTAVGWHADGQRIQVRINQPNCPEFGFVDSDYVTGDLGVEADNLAFRSQPKRTRETLKCSFNTGASLKVLGERVKVDGITWIKVSMNNPVEGCPAEGYVARSYLSSTSFTDLPLLESTIVDCPSCQAAAAGRAPGAEGSATDILQDLSDEVGEKLGELNEQQRGEGNQNARIKKLVKASRAAAAKCRLIAPHVCKRILGKKEVRRRLKRGIALTCGTRCGPERSKGWCKAGVREAFESAFGYTLPGGSALEARSALLERMTELKGVTCDDAPIGAVCLSRSNSHNFGHIEIKTGKNQYCSDFCAAAPTKRGHTPLAVFMP